MPSVFSALTRGVGFAILHAAFGGRDGLIFNLGHGIKPDGKIECMHALVETIVNYNNDSHLTEPALP